MKFDFSSTKYNAHEIPYFQLFVLVKG